MHLLWLVSLFALAFAVGIGTSATDICRDFTSPGPTVKTYALSPFQAIAAADTRAWFSDATPNHECGRNAVCNAVDFAGTTIPHSLEDDRTVCQTLYTDQSSVGNPWSFDDNYNTINTADTAHAAHDCGGIALDTVHDTVAERRALRLRVCQLSTELMHIWIASQQPSFRTVMSVRVWSKMSRSVFVEYAMIGIREVLARWGAGGVVRVDRMPFPVAFPQHMLGDSANDVAGVWHVGQETGGHFFPEMQRNYALGTTMEFLSCHAYANGIRDCVIMPATTDKRPVGVQKTAFSNADLPDAGVLIPTFLGNLITLANAVRNLIAHGTNLDRRCVEDTDFAGHDVEKCVVQIRRGAADAELIFANREISSGRIAISMYPVPASSYNQPFKNLNLQSNCLAWLCRRGRGKRLPVLHSAVSFDSATRRPLFSR